MSAAFWYAVCYEAEGVCETPFRSGNQENDPESILRTRDGRPFLQGTSLAGALRQWVEETLPDKAVPLFGSQENGGSLVVSDLVFEPNAAEGVRPRLRIDSKMGAADDGGKFDMAHVQRGSRFHFELVWLGNNAVSPELSAIEAMLSALHFGHIRLGAQKTNGFGRVSLSVTKTLYDMKNPAHRKCWMENQSSGEKNTLSLSEPAASGRVTFVVEGMAENLLVKSSVAEHRGNSSEMKNLMEGNSPVLPGSSVKGAVRSRCEKIAPLLGISKDRTDSLFGRGIDRNDGKSDDNGVSGNVYFEDVYLDNAVESPIARIHINRFTGGVMRKGLFYESPLTRSIRLQITVPAERKDGCLLVLYALRDLGLGLYNLGSGGSVGRGFLHVDSITVQGPDNQKSCLRFQNRELVKTEDETGLLAGWQKAVGGMNHEM